MLVRPCLVNYVWDFSPGCDVLHLELTALRRVREARVRSTLLVEAHLWHLIMHYLLPTTRMPLSFSLDLVSCTLGR
jgi:hypothetical protein